MRPILAAMLLLAPLSPTWGHSAAAPSAPARTFGAGHKLCGDWSAAETKTDQSEYAANRFWVAGFMSAYNVYVSTGGFDIGKGLTPDDMKAWMHDRCAATPTETIATAATAFLALLKARQGH